MDPAARHLIESIHQAPLRCVLALTGGGTGAAACLLEVPGGSRTILEAVIPYGEQTFGEFLGHRPEHFCSAATSQAMARRARDRARWLAPGQLVLGLGCAAGLATDRPKRGDHRFHISWVRGGRVVTYSLVLAKGARDRAGEEQVLDAVFLNALAEACGVKDRVEVPLLAGENLQMDGANVAGPAELVAGAGGGWLVEPDGRWRPLATGHKPAALLPGSFNPVHEGHWALAARAEQILGEPLAFELSVNNVDKPSLAEEEVRERLATLCWRGQVAVTGAATFVAKAQVFPGAVFVVGADTAARIVATCYYGNAEGLAQAMTTIREQGCRFLVAGRVDRSGRYLAPEELALPAEYRDLFRGIPDFRIDLSSTELREEERAGTN
jgi:hypothetical protein